MGKSLSAGTSTQERRPGSQVGSMTGLSHGLKNLEPGAGDETLNALAIVGHVRGGDVRLEGVEVGPPLDDGEDVVARRPLGGQAAVGVDGGAVLQAAVLGPDERHERAELGEQGVALAGGGLD